MRETAPVLTFTSSPCSSGKRMLALPPCRAQMMLQRIPSDEGVLSEQQTSTAAWQWHAVPALHTTGPLQACTEGRRTGSHCTVRLGHSRACVMTRSASTGPLFRACAARSLACVSWQGPGQ